MRGLQAKKSSNNFEKNPCKVSQQVVISESCLERRQHTSNMMYGNVHSIMRARDVNNSNDVRNDIVSLTKVNGTIIYKLMARVMVITNYSLSQCIKRYSRAQNGCLDVYYR